MTQVQAMQAVALLALLALATALPAMAEHPPTRLPVIIAPEVMTLERGSRKLKASCWNYVGKCCRAKSACTCTLYVLQIVCTIHYA